jgi:hypothetical protein
MRTFATLRLAGFLLVTLLATSNAIAVDAQATNEEFPPYPNALLLSAATAANVPFSLKNVAAPVHVFLDGSLRIAKGQALVTLASAKLVGAPDFDGTMVIRQIAFRACSALAKGYDPFPSGVSDAPSIAVNFTFTHGTSYDVPPTVFQFAVPAEPRLSRSWLCAFAVLDQGRYIPLFRLTPPA